jgi:histone-binding protein RBBP4
MMNTIVHIKFLGTSGHTARPSDFCWAPGEAENWTAASVSEDNIVMVWQPTMRIWAGDEVKIDEKELESDAMEGVESTTGDKGRAAGSGGSLRSQSMSVSVTSGDD